MRNSFLTNWKTTIFGVLALVSGLAPIWAPAHIATKIQASAAVFAASGLIVARDSEKNPPA